MSGSPPTPERALRRLEWTSLRRLDGLLQGNYRTLFRGAGLDLADLREYQYQDDIRRIDWNATARLQTPHVRDYLEDRELSAWFVLDLSPSVDFGSGALTKRDISVDFTGLLARILMRHGNRVGALCSDGGARHVLPARNGRQHLLQLMAQMMRPSAAPAQGVTDLGALLGAASGICPGCPMGHLGVGGRQDGRPDAPGDACGGLSSEPRADARPLRRVRPRGPPSGGDSSCAGDRGRTGAESG